MIGNQLIGGQQDVVDGQQRDGQSDKSRKLLDNARMAKDGIDVASTVISGLSKQAIALSDTFWSTLIDMATGGVLEKKWSDLTPGTGKEGIDIGGNIGCHGKESRGGSSGS